MNMIIELGKAYGFEIDFNLNNYILANGIKDAAIRITEDLSQGFKKRKFIIEIDHEIDGQWICAFRKEYKNLIPALRKLDNLGKKTQRESVELYTEDL